jgi:hypothetical protein
LQHLTAENIPICEHLNQKRTQGVPKRELSGNRHFELLITSEGVKGLKAIIAELKSLTDWKKL